MGRVLPPATLVALLAFVLAAAATAAPTPTPGVTSKQILIGSTGPLTGEAATASNVLRGADAYFKYINARGGVNGRQVKFMYLDDAYDPVKASQNAHQLVQQDKVFALFAVVGTDGNLAIRDYANTAGVPQVFSASGASALGRDPATYPWTIGYSPTYAGEGQVYAHHILATNPKKAKIAILYQADASGRDLLAGLRKGLGAKNRKLIVQTVGYESTDADVESQVDQLKASGANTFCIFAFGKFAIQAYVYADKLGWHPQVYVNNVASSSAVMRLNPQTTAEGSISTAWSEDPMTPKYAHARGVKLAASIIKTYVPGGSTTDVFLVAGMAEAYSLVDALNAAGRNLTRSGLMTAVTHMNETTNPFLVPGIVVHTTPTFRFPISQVQLQRWHKGRWVPFGPLLDAKT